MGTMTMTGAGPFTRAERDALPDDGRRHELIDGALVVTPSPSWRHQWVAQRLNLALVACCPEDLVVLFAPFDVVLGEDSVLQPDLLVARRRDFTERDLPVAPLLAVEILSPSTRQIDLTLKRARYESAGTPSYWVVDPDEPGLVAWDLVDGTYVEVARATGEKTFTATRPYDVTIAPARLLD